MDWLNEKLLEVEQLGINSVRAIFVVILAITYWRTKALVPVIVAAIVGGFVLFAVVNPGWFQQRVADESAPRGLVEETDAGVPAGAPVLVGAGHG